CARSYGSSPFDFW
nr:immunoglobulin heavy chain junction region [Mus musculus]MBK4188739.1 immunoglobulin heavy chain junction region [Mus musculus]